SRRTDRYCARFPGSDAARGKPQPRRLSRLKLNLHFFTVAPQPIQIIVSARLFTENVDHQVAIVHQHPLGIVISLHARRPLPLGLKGGLDFVGNGLELLWIIAATDEKE